jgi:hypothetical protein
MGLFALAGLALGLVIVWALPGTRSDYFVFILPGFSAAMASGISTLYYDIKYVSYGVPETLWFVEFTYVGKDDRQVNAQALVTWSGSEIRVETKTRTPVAVMVGWFLEDGVFRRAFLPAEYITHQEEIQTGDF